MLSNNKLAKLRSLCQLTQAELALQIKKSRSLIALIETERLLPSRKTAAAIAHVFGLKAEELFPKLEADLDDERAING